MPDGYQLDWRGEEVLHIAKENGAEIISEFSMEVVGESMRVLRRKKKDTGDKQGVASGTLRRSIHAALPGYDWGGDDVEPGPGTPDRSGQVAMPEANDQITVEVGSGMKYAMPVHQGHHSFAGYHYLTIGLTKAKAKLAAIIARHQVKR